MAPATMATTNAMSGRMSEACHGLFAPGAQPSLVLAHSQKPLERGFGGLLEYYGGTV